MQDTEFNKGLLEFLEASPTPFHAVETMMGRLECMGYQRLFESERWSIEKEQGYYVTRNDSSIIAFKLGDEDLHKSGIHMVGAHTDSPCLKVKPEPEMVKNGYFQLGVEVYGGALLNPWFDRDLSLAGRVHYLDKEGDIVQALINFDNPIAVIPSLAIHLDREANNCRIINAQTDIPPILVRLPNEDKPSLKKIILQLLNNQCDDCSAEEVLDYELFFYDVQPPAYVGLHQDFIASARLDNLLSCYTGLMSLLNSDDQGGSRLLVCNDHEEVGSMSTSGARSNFLKSVLERIVGSGESLSRVMDQSMLISTDNAHGIHPNYVDRYDENHGPVINLGPVIKNNANQRYATNSETSAVFRHYCKRADVPVQSFVVRNDMGCGSTIGPITASELGVKTLDVGVPTFAMHSIRELAGCWDAFYLYRVLKEFYNG